MYYLNEREKVSISPGEEKLIESTNMLNFFFSSSSFSYDSVDDDETTCILVVVRADFELKN
jgi:hypothetical protein